MLDFQQSCDIIGKMQRDLDIPTLQSSCTIDPNSLDSFSRPFRRYLDALKQTPLFVGMTEIEILLLLRCFKAKKNQFAKGSYLIRTGEVVPYLGIVVEGFVEVIQEDFWGNRNLVAKFGAGHIFAESFACAAQGARREIKSLVSVFAPQDCTILWLSPNSITAPCNQACPHHTRMLQNLLGVFALKNITLSEKLTHMGKHSTRNKLLSYLSAQAAQAGSSRFTIPFNRQQLADYLSVERSAMCVELSKLQAEGVLVYHRNNFELLQKSIEQ